MVSRSLQSRPERDLGGTGRVAPLAAGWNRPPVLAAAVALLALMACVAITPLTNNDVWLQMATGRWILENGHVPLHDPFSYTAQGNRFHAHEWLAGIIFHLVYRLAGVTGLILGIKAFLGASALSIAILAARRAGSGWFAGLAAGGLALVVVNSRFLERPEMFSYLFTALYVLVLCGEHRRLGDESSGAPAGGPRLRTFLRSSRIWWLLPVQWIWVQMHGYYLTGLALLGTFLAAELVSRLRSPRPSPLLHPRLLSGGAALLTLFLIGFLNPNGHEIYTFPFELAGGQNIFMQRIFEWKPTFSSPVMRGSIMFLAFCAWLGAWVAAALVSERSSRMPRLWRVAGGASLGTVLVLRLLLKDGSWLRPPHHLIAGITGWPPFLSDPDGIATLTWLLLGMAGLFALGWRTPAGSGPILVGIAVTLVLHHTSDLALPVLALSVLPALAFAAWQRRMPAWQLAVTLLFLFLAVRQNRNIVNFCLVTLPFLALSLSRARAALDGVLSRRRGSLRLATLAVVFALLGAHTLAFGWPYTPAVVKHTGLGIGARIPAGAVEYARRNGIAGRVFNKYAYGAYIIHELFPGSRVYMDSRNGVYGETLFREYEAALAARAVTERVFRERAFDWVLVDYNLYPAGLTSQRDAQGKPRDRWQADPGVHDFLADRGDWVLVYFDDTSMLLVPDRPENRELIRRDGYRAINPARYRPGVAGQLTSPEKDAFLRETTRAVGRHPESVAARLLHVDALVAAGDNAQALAQVDEVLRRQPLRLFTLIIGARLAARLDQPDRAVHLYRRALQLNPGMKQIQGELDRVEARVRR